MTSKKLGPLDKEFDSLVESMQTPKAKAAVRSLSTLAPGDFRKAAFRAATEKSGRRKD
ncbi:MAG TPA: hypothetical protein VGO35_07310 [Gammaproteobacteria bacterium]|nr:hypothetical protein [Gammaproteobacteria bacterium]